MLSKNKLAVALATMVGSTVALVSSSSWAQQASEAASQAAQTNANDVYVWAAVAAGFAIGIAALGGTFSQGRAVSAAVEGISRNPGAASRIQTAMILGVAMIESLVLFALTVAVLLWLKINVS